MDDAELRSAYDDVERSAPDGRPWVMANMVVGLDGSAAVGGRVGPLSGPADRTLFHHLRSLADIVLVGAATVRAERYGPPRLAPPDLARRRDQGRSEAPRLAVVSRSLDLDWTIPLFARPGPEGPPLLVTTDEAAASAGEAARHAELLAAGRGSVDLPLALETLRRRGCEVVLSEGGPTLLGELAAEGLLDELCLTLAPRLGGDPLPTVVWPAGAPAAELRLASMIERDGHLFLRYLSGP